MDGSLVLQQLQQRLQLSTDVYAQSAKYLQHAMSAKLDAKFNQTILACVAVYIYCRRNGVNITMSKICDVVPITREELMEAYDTVRKIL